MKLQTAAKIAASQQEYQVKVQDNGQTAMYLGTDMQAALGLQAGQSVYVGVKGKRVSLSSKETEETMHQLKLHQVGKQLRAYVKKDTPALPKVRRISDSIVVNQGIAQFNY